MVPLVLLFSYNRPTLIRGALHSLEQSTVNNWKLGIIDDASDFDISSIVEEEIPFAKLYKDTNFIKIQDSKEGKLARGGSWIGLYANTLMESIPADFVVFLCDDDKLKPDYLQKLAAYYEANPEVMYSYCHIETFGEGADGTSWLNKTGTIDPFCQVDASQVSWRTKCIKEGGVRFPYPKTSCLDSELFGQLCNKYGLCPFNGLVGQLKRVHKNQLGNHSSLDKVD